MVGGIMTLRPSYPLEPLLEQRQEVVDARASDLLQRLEAAKKADVRKQRATSERQRHAAMVAEQTRREVNRFERGELVALDLMRWQAWRLAQAHHAQELAQQETIASERAVEAERREREARAQLAVARADAKVVEVHKRRFEAERRRVEAHAAEMEAEDQVTACCARRRA
jgi:hypothetical protein